MPKNSPGATITPHFREFLPSWVARQPWYRGGGVPSFAMIGAYRLEDPDGEVGMEAHLISDGDAVYQLPMTYRGAPLPDVPDGALIATAEHSVLGARWIYDAEADPVWHQEILRLVRDGEAVEGHVAAVRGQPLDPGTLDAGGLVIDLRRVLAPGEPAVGPGIAGLMMGSWSPGGAGTESVTGCLALIHS